MFGTRLIRLLDQSHIHAHEHHQLVMPLARRAELEVNGCGGEVCRMRACLVPGKADHVFAGVGDDHMLIIDLGGGNPVPEDPGPLVHLFKAPRYSTLDIDFQNLLGYAGVELVHCDGDPLLTRALDRVLIRALHLCLLGEQRPLATSGPLDLEYLDARIVWNLARCITVAELIQVTCLSPGHLHARLKDNVGLTLRQYLLKVRPDCVARLLRESRLPLARIVEECSFSSQNALTTAMRCYLGLTPKSLCRG